MPSGPKKRLRARRKKQGSPATDANSDRETEALSVTGSMDVDDLESGLDTPGKASTRPSFLDRDAVSSQTNEWVRVSNFDVGTPTSQTGENEPSAEDADVSSSRRSLDKLSEWETVSGENIPGRQEGSINSLEEEPSEVEAASGHSSESYMHLPSPHPPGRDKYGYSSDSDRNNIPKNRSSTSSSGSSEVKSALATSHALDSSATLETGEEVTSAPHLSPVPSAGDGEAEDIERSTEDSIEKGVVYEAVDDVPPPAEVGTITPTPDNDDHGKTETSSDAVLEESNEQEKEVPAATEAGLVATNPDEKEEIASSAKDISEVNTPLSIPSAEEETLYEDHGVLPVAESVGQVEATSSLVDVEDKEVNVDENVASGTIADSTGADEKEVASTSADTEDEKSKSDDSDLDSFVEKKFVEKISPHPLELTADSLFVKASGTSGRMALVEDRHLSITTMPVEKNGIEKPPLEAKSSGCCGVLYWLLGSDR